MSINNLSCGQIDMVAGGFRDELNPMTARFIGDMVNENQFFRESIIIQCLSVVKLRYGVSLCLPKRKPLSCSYESWGMLHDLEETMPAC